MKIKWRTVARCENPLVRLRNHEGVSHNSAQPIFHSCRQNQVLFVRVLHNSVNQVPRNECVPEFQSLKPSWEQSLSRRGIFGPQVGRELEKNPSACPEKIRESDSLLAGQNVIHRSCGILQRESQNPCQDLRITISRNQRGRIHKGPSQPRFPLRENMDLIIFCVQNHLGLCVQELRPKNDKRISREPKSEWAERGMLHVH